MPDPNLKQALKEAYASVPVDLVVLHTLELRHPAFREDEGQLTAVRLVRDHHPLTARLETSAPLQAGQLVVFTAMAFQLELPQVDTSPVPEIQVTIDNVSREMIRHLDQAIESGEKVRLTYRPYLSNDLEGPQMDPPLHLVLTEVEANIFQVSGRARMLDLGNKTFPAETYTSLRFPGLTR